MKRVNRSFLIALSALALAFLPAVSPDALADGGDFSLDFTAAAPLTYDHATGGGAYNDRTVGRDKDIVESLEGGDFDCGDIVTFLTQIVVDDGASGSQTIQLTYEFTAHSTGQQGVALVDNDAVGAGVSAAINVSAIDFGTVDNGNSTATVIDEHVEGTVFVKPSDFIREVRVDGLEAGESVVLRTDVAIVCNGETPTGNMQARLAGSIVTAPADQIDVISSGDQTIPFKHVARIGDCDPKIEECPPCDPKTEVCP